MIEHVSCIIIKCNACKVSFEDFNGWSIFVDECKAYPEDSGWYRDGDTHYCPSCHKTDEEGYLIETAPVTDTGK